MDPKKAEIHANRATKMLLAQGSSSLFERSKKLCIQVHKDITIFTLGYDVNPDIGI